MRRLSVPALLGLFALLFAVLYLVKYEVQAVKDRNAALRAQIAEEEESLRILEAEWAFLNQPSRLRRLAEAHLMLQPVTPKSIVALGDLPRRDAPPAAAGEE